MMALIFISILSAVIWAWSGYRRAARYGFSLALILGVISFCHHISSELGLQL